MKPYLLILIAIIACSSDKEGNGYKKEKPVPLSLQPPLNPPTNKPLSYVQKPIVYSGARILVGNGVDIQNGYIIIENGKIASVGEGEPLIPEGATHNKLEGKTITPGIIDSHSHMGVYPMPMVNAHMDGNESSNKVTPQVWAEHGFWPQDPSLWRALSSGVTSIQVLPGSANLIGGRSFTAKLKVGASARDMKFPGAPQGIKMACGENPKRVYNDKGLKTRMGNVAGFREQFQKAREYLNKQNKYERDLTHWKAEMAKAGEDEKKQKDIGDPPTFERNLALETLALVLEGKLLVHNHCYRSDEMSIMLDLAKEYGFKIRSFHHALEAYKIADRLKEEGTSVSTWVDWWGYKMEAFDGIPQNASLLHKKGVRVIIHSDSETEVRHLNTEVAKSLQAASKIGLKISEGEAISWITLNPAWALGVDSFTGSLEAGKMADFVIWNGTPFSILAKAEQVYIDGELMFDRKEEKFPLSDFELGQNDWGIADGRTFTLNLPDAKFKVENLLPPPYEVPKTINKNFILRNVRIFDRKVQKWQQNDIKIESGKISLIGKGAVNPKKYPEINGDQNYVTPTFYTIGSQAGLSEVSGEKSTVDSNNDGKAFSPFFRVIDSFNPFSVYVDIWRSEGISHSLLRPRGGFIEGMGQFVTLDNELDSLSKNTPKAMFMSLQSGRTHGLGGSRNIIWMKFRNLLDEVRDYKRTRKGYRTGKTRDFTFNKLELESMLPVLSGKIPLVVDVSRAADIFKLIQEVKRLPKSERIKLVLFGAQESWKLSDEIKKMDIPVIITPSLQGPDTFDSISARDDIAAYLNAAGIKVIIKSQEEPWSTRVRQQAGFAQKFGLPEINAYESITINPAQIFGLQKQGLLIAGYDANLVMWSGHPFEPSSSAVRLWINGKEQSLMNRQLKLALRYKRRLGL